MKGNKIGEFIDDLMLMGGPEKEFIFHDKYYFLETTWDNSNSCYTLCIDEYDNTNPKSKSFIRSYKFTGRNYIECVKKFECSKIFDGMTIYQAEQEIEVLFG
ncbi:hypothetical protein [Pseudoramibacter sp.]|jgi:hypothetical protein|uniref:hypothetical protein n=1 Tax=Pseudoramibacter sp. TaxID=2034862 RepID=UPI0025D0B381|nr:hypothetical protein [Pseudoramibacter sp.]MCH4071430.1 hypothetical protein [Pseudoramibacter sp.]MCH4105198.1 hypothetical protein [Pseudoramibacter sp.]